jgi:glycosyltransferase involved in cell wall biosynthesis
MNEKSIDAATPTVSVITGYYNRGHALDITIDSIMNQTYTDFELIVFNDKSTDDTEQRLEKIRSKYNDPRLVIINHDENKGFVQGMIDAVKLAKGKYICVQGSGDVSYEDRLKEQVLILENQPKVGVVGCFYENYVEDRNIIRARKTTAENITLNELAKANVFSHGEVMFRKDVYENVGGYRAEFVNCQDYDLWLRMVKETELATAQAILYRRFIRYDGVSYKPNKFLKQSRYFFLCQDLALKSPEEQKHVLNKVAQNGIESYMGLASSRMQNRIIKAVLRSAVWGNYDAAKEVNQKGVQSSLVRTCLRLFIMTYRSIIGYPIRKLVNKKFGIE